MSERERWSQLCLTRSLQSKKAPAPLNLLPLSLSYTLSPRVPVKQRQLQCLRLEGPWLKVKPDSSSLRVDHGRPLRHHNSKYKLAHSSETPPPCSSSPVWVLSLSKNFSEHSDLDPWKETLLSCCIRSASRKYQIFGRHLQKSKLAALVLARLEELAPSPRISMSD